MDGLSHNTSWEVEHGVDGPLMMVSVFSAWEPVTLGKYLMKYGPVILDCMGTDPRDVVAKENWNKSSHGHKLAKSLMTLLW